MTTTTKNIINSFIIVPMIATTLSMNVFTTAVNQSIAKADSEETLTTKESLLEKDRLQKAAKIDAYFGKYNLPLTGYGMAFVVAAEKHDLPWNLLPAIAMRESTGGKFSCRNNPFGWGSCKIGFKDYNDAIETLALHLGGDHPATASYYDGKTVKGILQTYNPPSVVATYADQVMGIMNSIDRVQV